MKTKLLSALVILAFAPSLVFAARPSINELNTRVNQLEAENNAQQAEIDALRTDVDDNKNRIDALPKTLVVLDANDKKVGTASSRENVDDADVYFEVDGRLINVRISKDRFGQGNVWYDQINCLGTPHVALAPQWMVESGGVRGTSVFRPIPNTTPAPVLRSMWRTDSAAPDGLCDNFPSGLECDECLPSEVVIDLSEFTPPFRYSVAP